VGRERIRALRRDLVASAGGLESPRLAWFTLGGFFFLGASIGAASLLLPHPSTFDDAALWSNVAIAYAGCAACLFGGYRGVPGWVVQLALLAGTVVITRAVYLSGDPTAFYIFWYVWVGLHASFFFGRIWGALQIAAVGVAYAWLLTQLDTSSPLARWLTLVATIAGGGIVISELVDRVRGYAARSATIARERAELLAKLEEVARTDDLTGLLNRRAWNEELQREIARARREETALCVGIIDLDWFKGYNDEYGHPAGDRLLKQIALTWRSQLRLTDVLARYGGEEFAFALPGCDLDDALALTERLRGATPGTQTCSVGLVAWDREEGPDRLIDRADAALYTAKAAGRDRVVVG
jgi:diguanylate cyclase (GGDEF)-like protein